MMKSLLLLVGFIYCVYGTDFVATRVTDCTAINERITDKDVLCMACQYDIEGIRENYKLPEFFFTKEGHAMKYRMIQNDALYERIKSDYNCNWGSNYSILYCVLSRSIYLYEMYLDIGLTNEEICCKLKVC